MSCDDSTNRLWWIALAVCVGLLAWVFFEASGAGPEGDDAVADQQTRTLDADMLEAASSRHETGRADLVSDPAARADSGLRTRGTLTVTVVGPHDTPLPHVPVILFEDLPGKPPGRFEEGKADGSGRVVFADVPFGGAAEVRVTRVLLGGTIQNIVAAKVTSPTLRLHVGMGLPVTARVLDSRTGRQRPGVLDGWVPAFADLAGKPSPTSDLVALGGYVGAELHLSLRAANGYYVRPTLRQRFPLPPDVLRLQCVVPLHREANLLLIAAAGGQLPKAKPMQAEVVVGRQAYTRDQFEVDGFGRVHLPGIPFRQYVPVRAHVVFEDGSHGKGRGRMGSGESTDVVIELEITPMADEDVIREEEIEDHVEFGPSHSPGPGAAAGGLTLKLRRIDGALGADAWAVLARDDGGALNWRQANAKGVAQWERIRPGRYQVHIWGLGANLIQDVAVHADGVALYELRGTTGGRLKVSVHDQAGNALPYTALKVTDAPHFRHSDVTEDGQQRIDPYTEHDGTRTLHRIRPGEVDVIVTYAGFRMGKKVEIRAGRTTDLDFVLDLSR